METVATDPTGGRTLDAELKARSLTPSTPLREGNRFQIRLEAMKMAGDIQEKTGDYSRTWITTGPCWPMEGRQLLRLPGNYILNPSRGGPRPSSEKARWRPLVFTGIIRTAVNFIKFSCC